MERLSSTNVSAALQHFEVYVTSSSLPIVLYSVHSPLVFIHKMKDKNQRLLSWSLMLQGNVLEITHQRKGQCHCLLPLRSVRLFAVKFYKLFFVE